MLLEGGDKKSFENYKVPVVSILIVTYNAASVLPNCLESIYKQTYPNLEIIVIDGQSTDSTINILTHNSQHLSYWRSERDNGIYDAMNKALGYATGDWIYFIGADDTLYDGFSEMCYALENPNTVYYGRVLTHGGLTFPVSDYQFAKIGICHQAIIYPKSVFLNNYFDVSYKISADFAFNISLYGNSKYRFEFRDFLIAKFNHTGVSSTNIDQRFEKDRSVMVIKNFGLLIWVRYLVWKLKKLFKTK
jgi:glycosyltransferase involved in cell wall biosynthesis